MGASVTVPLDQAFTRAKQITFQPFDLRKWFVLGFAAWLATLLESGMNFNFNVPGSGGGPAPGGRGGPGPGGVDDFLRPIWQWITKRSGFYRARFGKIA
jgi:hypothetical protein